MGPYIKVKYKDIDVDRKINTCPNASCRKKEATKEKYCSSCATEIELLTFADARTANYYDLNLKEDVLRHLTSHEVNVKKNEGLLLPNVRIPNRGIDCDYDDTFLIPNSSFNAPLEIEWFNKYYATEYAQIKKSLGTIASEFEVNWGLIQYYS